MDNNEIFDKLKDGIKQQIQEAYTQGAHEGSIATAATLYSIMLSIGLEEDNIFFDILKDLAKRHGCEDLKAYLENLNTNKENHSDSLLSWYFIKNMI